MQDRRSIERKDLIYFPRVFDKRDDQLIGRAANISTTGVMLIGETPVKSGTTFHLGMHFPVAIGGKKQLDFEAQSRWCRTNGNAGGFISGFKLNNISSDDLDVISQISAKGGLDGKQPPTLKRLFDVLVSSVGLLVCSPLLLLIGVVLRLESPGSPFYSSMRVGKFGRLFRMYKFRTMVDAPESSGPKITAHDDPRVTKIGRFLRQTKLNELPQLFNVFLGDMSFVGPRPEDEEFVAQYTPEEREILAVTPGITSLATILYADEERLLRFTDVTESYLSHILPDKLRLDLIYVRNQSMLLDIDILLQTMLVLVPRLRSAAPKAEDILSGPLRKARRTMSWFAIDAVIAILAIGAAGLVWRLAGPLDVGLGLSLIFAIFMTALFLVANWLIGVQRVEWRYASPADAIGVIASSFIAILTMIVANTRIPTPNFPGEMLIVAGLFAMSGFLAARYHRLLLSSLRNPIDQLRTTSTLGQERVLIVGAGDAGQIASWLLRNNPAGRIFDVVGIVDDDINKLGLLIHRVPVVGLCDRIPEIAHEMEISTIVFAIHSIDENRRAYLLRACSETDARTVIVPDLLSGLSEITAPGEKRKIPTSAIGHTPLVQPDYEGVPIDLRNQIRLLADEARSGDIADVALRLDRLDKSLEVGESSK